MEKMTLKLVFGLAVAGTLAMQASSVSAQQLPAVKLLTAPLVTPSAAWSYYTASTTHSNGVAAWSTRPAEIKELAIALGKGRYTADNYANYVYEYIRNNIKTEFRFGLAKGARGAVIDQSGTPFDQAHLMVELLREGGITANYQAGTISLTAAQFGKWTGFVTSLNQSAQTFSVNAKAACQFLADGGMPATVNGATACTSLSGNLATSGTPIVMGHAWVQATIGTTTKYYDPSFKTNVLKAGVDLAAAMGCGTDATQTCSSTILTKTGSTQGNVLPGDSARQGRIDVQMNTYATALQTWIQDYNNNNKTNLLVEDVIGGAVLDTTAAFAAGTVLPYTTAVTYTWSEIPDSFRTKLRVRIDQIDTSLFVDEYYGQRLRIFQDTVNDQANSTTRRLTLYLETRPISARSSYAVSRPTVNPSIYLDVNHPYAATNGNYADDALAQLLTDLTINSYDSCTQQRQLYPDQNLVGCLPGNLWYTNVVSIVQFWGDSSQNTISHYGALQQRDNTALASSDPNNVNHIWPLWLKDPGSLDGTVWAQDLCSTAFSAGNSVLAQPSVNPGCREEHQAVLAATWAAEASQVWYLASQINRGAAQQHHHLGVIMSGKAVRTNLMSIQSAISVNSTTAISTNRTALFASGTQAMNRLEGGVIEQIFDAWDGGSSSSLLVKSNQRGLAFLELTSGTGLSGLNSGSFTTGQLQVFQNYLSQNFTLIVPQYGLHEEQAQPCLSNPINGVCRAPFPLRYPFTGMVAENASATAIALLGAFETKGAGFGTSASPDKSALDSVKVGNYSTKARDYFGVNLQSAELTLTPAADLTTGVGAFPMSLSFQRTYTSAKGIDAKDCTTPTNYGLISGQPQPEPEYRSADLGGGWSNNWSIYLRTGSDGLAGLGRDSALNAVGAIAGLYVTGKLNAGTTRTMRERLATVFANNGWVQNLQNNVVTTQRGNSTSVFVRSVGGTGFNAPPGVNERLTQNGNREVITKGIPVFDSWSTKWDFTPITYDLLMADGSTMHFIFGRNTLDTELRRSVGYWVPSAWSFASGVTLTFTYANHQVDSGVFGIILEPGDLAYNAVPYPGMPGYTSFSTGDYISNLCLKSVSNNFGRALNFDCGYFLLSKVSDENGRSVQFRSETLAANGGGTDGLHNAAPLCRPSKFYVTDAEGQITRYDYATKPTTAIERDYPKIVKWYTPSDQTNPFVTVAYDSLYRVKSTTDNATTPAVTNYFSTGLYGAENQKRGEIQDALTGLTTKYFDLNSNLTGVIDPLGRATYNSYDSARRLKKTTYPEGNSTEYAYDARSNRLTTTQHAKSGSGLPDIVSETKTYGEGPTVGACTNQAICNLVASVTDSKGYKTDYTYNQAGTAPTAQLLQVKGPAVSGGNATTNYCYNNYPGYGGGTITLLTGKVELASSGVNRVTSYAYNGGNKYVLSGATVDPTSTLTPVANSPFCTGSTKSGALNLTTAFAIDGVGNVSSINGPRTDVTDVTTYNFDKLRRLTRTVSPAVTVNGSSVNPITRYTYDTDGLLRTTRRSLVATPTDANPANPWPTDLNAAHWQTETRDYYATGDLKTVTDAQNNITSYVYDKLGRPTVITDPDSRRTGTVYDAAGQTTCVWKAWNSASAPGNCTWSASNYAGNGNTGLFRYAAYTYTLNGKQKTVQDANTNQTDYVYDKHDRPRFTFYPDPSTGSRCTAPTGETGTPTCPTGATYEELWYTADGSTTATRCSANNQPCRKRLRNGQTITYNTYDALDRLITKTPQGQGAITYSYNLLSEPLSISEAASGSYAAHTTSYAYDAAGRKQSETNDGRQVSYQYDAASNRTRTTWPDGYFVNYQYDALNRMQYVRENSTTGNELAFYDYDILSRRGKLRFGGNESNRSTYTYETDNDLDVVTQLMNSTTVTLDYGRNKSHQITSIVANDDFYLPKPAAGASQAYVTDKLNRYGSVAGQAATYDTGGNLLTWFPLDGSGKDTYTYDSENRLVTAAVNGSSTATISYDYDALGRRVKKTVSGTVTQYLLDGDEEIAELNSTGTVLRRYITGPAIDDRIARAEGSATSNPTKTYYRTNHQGSVVATTDATGAVTQRLAYDEYGKLAIGAVTTGEQFRYTGRRFDPETNLYYYRARYYAPDIGRFLQTDPIGYGDDFNLYAYVGNDPVNGTDPTGLECTPSGDVLNCDPPGNEIGSYTIPRPAGHEGVSSSDKNYDSYQTGASTSNTSAGLKEAATQDIVNNPTPGNDNAATPEGTRNDAGINPFPNQDNVLSFVTTDSNGNTVVVNLSVPGEHVFDPAVVSQVVTQDAAGTHVTVVGESSASIHSGGNRNPLNIAAKFVFGQMAKQHLENAKKRVGGSK